MRDMENGIEPVGLTRIWSPLGFVFKRSTTNGQLFPTRAYTWEEATYISYFCPLRTPLETNLFDLVSINSQRTKWIERRNGREFVAPIFPLLFKYFVKRHALSNGRLGSQQSHVWPKIKALRMYLWTVMECCPNFINAWEANKKPSCRQCHNPPLFSHVK